MPRDAAYWIEALELRPHPEGGMFSESWRSAELLPASALPPRFGGPRSLGTAIYFLLRSGERARFHRLHADELWHLLDGGPLTLHLLTDAGAHVTRELGHEVAAGQAPQQFVPHGHWFAAEAAPASAFALVSCTVVPGFEYSDFELADRAQLIALHPDHAALIQRFTEA